MIAYLISMGAEPNAVDKTGVAPLHRASLDGFVARKDGRVDWMKNPKQGPGKKEVGLVRIRPDRLASSRMP